MEKQGHLIRARELLLRLAREELPANAPQAFRDAQTQTDLEAGAIEPRLASVVIIVKAPSEANPSVEMDGKPVSSAVLGVAVPADPGTHEFRASAPGYSSDPRAFTLTEGGQGRVELQLLERESSAVKRRGEHTARASEKSGELTEPPAVSSSSGQKLWMRPAAYVAFGVGAV